MNSTKLAFNVQRRHNGKRETSICFSLMTTKFRSLLGFSQHSPSTAGPRAKNHDLWKIQTFTASQRRNDSSYGHKSQVMSDTIPATLSLPFDTPRKYSNHRLQTLSCKESLIVLSLYCIQCLSVSTWVSHLESWLLVCDMQHLKTWPAPGPPVDIMPAPPHRLPSLTDVKLLILKVDINIVTFTFYRIHRLIFKDTQFIFSLPGKMII